MLPNGGKTIVIHIGSYTLGGGFIISKVLFVPEFKYNLIFVSQLIVELSCTIFFDHNGCKLQDQQSGVVSLIGKKKDNLFFLLQGTKDSFVSLKVAVGVEDVMLWHQRLGHLPVSKFSHVP